MPGIDTDIMQHYIPIDPTMKQAEVEKNETRVDSQDQRRSRETVQCRIPKSGQLRRMVS